MKVQDIVQYERRRASRTVIGRCLLRARKKDKKASLRKIVNLAKPIRYPSRGHRWGDGFPFFGDVEEAAEFIGNRLIRLGRVNVTTTKEKYGTASVYCSFGWSQLFSITHPGYAYGQYPKWLWHLDCTYISKLFRYINILVVPYHERLYRSTYHLALQIYPHIRDEILYGADYTELLEGL